MRSAGPNKRLIATRAMAIVVASASLWAAYMLADTAMAQDDLATQAVAVPVHIDGATSPSAEMLELMPMR